ncbi:hypothetical protein KCU92_g69, partial [Aureobasidium melanogenum]
MASAIVTSTVRAVAQLRARIHVLLPRAVSSMQSQMEQEMRNKQKNKKKVIRTRKRKQHQITCPSPCALIMFPKTKAEKNADLLCTPRRLIIQHDCERYIKARIASCLCTTRVTKIAEKMDTEGGEIGAVRYGQCQPLHCVHCSTMATSSKLAIISVSSPTARVMRLARALRRLWSMFSSHGEPGARKALYKPEQRLARCGVKQETSDFEIEGVVQGRE